MVISITQINSFITEDCFIISGTLSGRTGVVVKNDMPIGSLGLSNQEKYRIAVLYAPIFVATAVGIAAMTSLGSASVVLAGLGISAYVFGLRHGMDADHIAAIDNTTRKLMQDGKKPLTIGTWFSLGHSTIVMGLIVALVLATRSVISFVPSLQHAGFIIGTLVSGTFLWLIGIINLLVAVGVYATYKELRSGSIADHQLDNLLNKRGFLNRYFSPLIRMIEKPWQAYPLGLLFGLGFDTASEIALIAISVGVGVSASVPIWTIAILPFMFTCGMVLVDTTDGITMRLAYGWAFLKPIRKIYYNLTITIISVLVAFVIGTVEVVQVLARELLLSGGIWTFFYSLDFESLGAGIVLIFVLSWMVSIILYKYRKIEEIGFKSK